MRLVVIAMAALVSLLEVRPMSAVAVDVPVCFDRTLQYVASGCQFSEAEYVLASTTVAGAWEREAVYDFQSFGKDHMECASPAGTYQYEVLFNGVDVGNMCAEQRVATLNLAAAIRAARNLQWPSSKLKIQPPGGEVLVSGETIYFTLDSGVRTQRMVIMGIECEFRATPTRYSWNFGDGDSEVSDGPGAPYPAQTITHEYSARGEYTPSVDTSYQIEVREVGKVDWFPLPDPVDVAGDTVSVAAVEARPTLVR